MVRYWTTLLVVSQYLSCFSFISVIDTHLVSFIQGIASIYLFVSPLSWTSYVFVLLRTNVGVQAIYILGHVRMEFWNWCPVTDIGSLNFSWFSEVHPRDPIRNPLKTKIKELIYDRISKTVFFPVWIAAENLHYSPMGTKHQLFAANLRSHLL